jgi:hypothetical protein
MAKIDFTAKEIEVLQKAAAEAQKAGAERAKAIIQESGIEFPIAPEIRKLIAPEATSIVGGSDNCYACIACVFTVATIALAYTK